MKIRVKIILVHIEQHSLVPVAPRKLYAGGDGISSRVASSDDNGGETASTLSTLSLHLFLRCVDS